MHRFKLKPTKFEAWPEIMSPTHHLQSLIVIALFPEMRHNMLNLGCKL